MNKLLLLLSFILLTLGANAQDIVSGKTSSILLQMSTGTKNGYGHLLIGGILLVIYLIYKATSKEKPIPDLDYDTTDDIDTINDYAVSISNVNKEKAIIGFKKVLSIDPNNVLANGFLGSLIFYSDANASFKHLSFFFNHLKETEDDFENIHLSGVSLNLYMLGYLHDKNGSIKESQYFKSLSMKDESFPRTHTDFIIKYKY